MSHNSMGAMGDMASGFVSGQGGFDPATGKYSAEMNANPNGSSFAFDAQTMNTQAALNGALAFGGGVLPQGMGMMAGILPAALKIEEHKKMREVAERYYEKYIKDFNRKYGFKDDQIKDLVDEFKQVTDEICRLIPDDKMRDMYQKYIDSYPTMYLSMIPAEALQTKLAVKCVTENKILRGKIEEMSGCVSTLVKNLTDLQISAGIPPIVNLMFESMPDPLTAITDPMYHKYNDAIVTYHKLLKDTNQDPNIVRVDGNPNNRDFDGSALPANQGLTNADLLRLEPVHYLKQVAGDLYVNNENIKLQDIKDLMTVMENMQTQSGCQPFGDEWNHTGPQPAMNPAMCLGENDRFQSGNPRHNVGRTNLYQAKRDQNGNAQWVQTGQIPALSAGAPQMVQHQPQVNANQWAGQSHMPGVDMRPSQQTAYGMPPVQGGQFNQQFTGSRGKAKKSRSTGGKKPKRSSRKTT